MINGLICSGQLSLSAWEPYVQSNAEQAQSFERRWRRFLENRRICVDKLYIPLAMAALKDWQNHRLYLAIDTTMLWNRFCMIHIERSMLWSSNSTTMACIGTWQRDSSV